MGRCVANWKGNDSFSPTLILLTFKVPDAFKGKTYVCKRQIFGSSSIYV